jgi:hypothetical protein
MHVIPESANWAMFGNAAGPKRNEFMIVNYHPDMIVGFHNDYIHSKGTKDMLMRGKDHNIYTLLITLSEIVVIHSKEFTEEEMMVQKKLC